MTKVFINASSLSLFSFNFEIGKSTESRVSLILVIAVSRTFITLSECRPKALETKSASECIRVITSSKDFIFSGKNVCAF